MFKTLLTVAAAGAISVLAPAAEQAASTGPTPPPVDVQHDLCPGGEIACRP